MSNYAEYSHLYIAKSDENYQQLLSDAIDLLLRLNQKIVINDEGFGIVLEFAADPFSDEMGQDRLMWVTLDEAEFIEDRRIDSGPAETDLGTDI